MIYKVSTLGALLLIANGFTVAATVTPAKATKISIESKAPTVISHLDENGVIGVTNNLASPTTAVNTSGLKSNNLKPVQGNVTPHVESGSPKIVMSNLGSIDSNTSDLVSLKRKLEIEKAELELKKIQNGGTSSSNLKMPGFTSENAQTIVTGVAINQEGRKIAWLQFADGGSLTVNIGSNVGKYTVSDITMSGVELSSLTGKRHQHIFLNRAYYAPEKPKQGGNNSFGFAPSPIVTSANSNEMVPPIVPVR
ncbi:MAG: hypothetical protein K0R49_780 [Burkholderiales bacterium]|jgi:hypothetical protein|nr:hypothetical protein [Burkholderiales bacterium]